MKRIADLLNVLNQSLQSVHPEAATEKQLRHGCSPANLQHIFRTLSPKSTSGRLLLKGTPHYPMKIGKSLPEYLIFKRCSEFILSTKNQNISVSQAKRNDL